MFYLRTVVKQGVHLCIPADKALRQSTTTSSGPPNSVICSLTSPSTVLHYRTIIVHYRARSSVANQHHHWHWAHDGLPHSCDYNELVNTSVIQFKAFWCYRMPHTICFVVQTSTSGVPKDFTPHLIFHLRLGNV